MGIVQTLGQRARSLIDIATGANRKKKAKAAPEESLNPPGAGGLGPTSTGGPQGPYAGYGGFGQGWGPGGFQVNPLLPGAKKDWLGQAGDLWRNSVVSACLGWLQDNGPQAKLTVCKVEDDEKTETPIAHPLLGLLGAYGRPNKSYSKRALWSAVYLSWKVDGNAYLIPARGSGGIGEPVELWWEPHWNVTPWRDVNSTRLVDKYFVWRPTGRYILNADEIIHLRDGIDPHNPMLGLGRLKSQARNIVGLNDAETYSNAIVASMGGIGVVWMPDGDTVDELEAKGEKRRIQRGTRAENAGGLVAMTIPGKIERIALSPEEMALDTILDRPEATVCAVTGVQAMSVGLAVGASQRTFSNIKEADRMSWMNGLVPMQDGMAEELEYQILPMFFEDSERLVIRFDRSGVDALQRESAEKTDEAVKLRQAGIISHNEARAIIDQPPNEGGDKSPIEEAAEAAAQFAETTKQEGLDGQHASNNGAPSSPQDSVIAGSPDDPDDTADVVSREKTIKE